MNGNRGQYNSAPLYNMKNKKQARPPQPEGPLPPSGPRQSRGFERALSVVMSIPLPALFLLALFIANRPLRLAFLVLTVVAVALMWLMKAFVRSARSTLTVVYGALAAVILVALFVSPQPVSRTTPASTGATQSEPSLNTDANYLSAINNGPQATGTPAPADSQDEAAVIATSETQQRLYAFFQAWARNSVNEMLEYCVPSWVSQQQEPAKVLYQLALNSTPVDFLINTPDGSDGDTSRTVTVTAHFNELSGQQTYKRLQVFMQKVNNVWYVNPNSLSGTIIDEAADAGQPAQVHVNTTIAPTATPAPNGSGITVYYNPDRGKYYHAIPNCPDVNEKFWPLTGFSYDLLNSQQYKSLMRCPTCGAPERPPLQ